MSISLFDAPDDIWQPVERPILWEFQSDRVTDLTTTVSSIATASGFAKYTLSAVHDMQVGDTVLGSGISADYNVSQQVTAVTQTTVTTDQAYVDDQSGTLTRGNDSFRVKATVYKGVGEHEVISTTSDHTGNARFSMSANTNVTVGDLVAISGSNIAYGSLQAINDDSGKVQYDTGTHVVPVGAAIVVTAVTVDTTYNVTQRVTAVTATTITTDLDSGSVTGSPTNGVVTWSVYDGVHTALVVSGTDVTVNTAWTEAATTGTAQEVTLIGSKKQQQITDSSGNSIFRFNFSNFLKSELSFDLAVLTAGSVVLTDTSSSIINYSVTLTEQFEDDDGLIVDGLSIQTSPTYKACNIALQHTDVQDLDVYTVDTSAKLFLTNTPNNAAYQANDFIQLSFLTAETTIKGKIEEYDDDLSLTTAIYNTATTTIVADRGILTLDTSTFQSDTTIVVAGIVTGAGGQVSAKVQYDLDSKCYDREILVWWLNRLGGFDYYRFTSDRTNSLNIGKTTYTSPLAQGFATSDRGDSTLGVDAHEQVEVYSDWILDSEADWLGEIFTSKHVYVQETARGATNYVPILVTDSKVNLSRSRDMVQLRMKYKRPDLLING